MIKGIWLGCYVQPFSVGRSHRYNSVDLKSNNQAIGFLYSGMTRRKAAGTMLLQCLFCASVVGIQFWIYGFSMIMSRSDSVIIGNLDLAFLRNTLGYGSQSNAAIPDILLAAFHFTFVTATAMILAGAMLERGRLFPTMLFLLCWVTFVYCFLAYVHPQVNFL